MLKELWQYREMVRSLVKRDLKSRYKGSVLGFLWMFLNPLLQLCIYTIVFDNIIKMDIDRFYLFLFVALVPWIFFSTCLSYGTTAVLGQQDLVKKIYFPREVLPIAFTISQFINMLLSFIVIFIVMLLSRIAIDPVALLFLPLVAAVEFVFSLGIVFITSAITVYFRDLEHILSIIAMAWMYLTPIIYPIEFVPKDYLGLFYLNPMTSITIAYRDILYYGRVPKVDTLANAWILALVVYTIGRLLFLRLKRGFAKEL